VNRTEDEFPSVRIAVIDPMCTWMYPTDITVHLGSTRLAVYYAPGVSLGRGFALGGMIADSGDLLGCVSASCAGGWFEVRIGEGEKLVTLISKFKEEITNSRLNALRLYSNFHLALVGSPRMRLGNKS
jgi:hypothetical protein